MNYGRNFGLGAVVAALAACGGGMGGTTSTTSGGSPDAGGTVAPAVAPSGTSTDGGTTTSAALTLTIQGMAFSPENLTVPAGATVQVVNMDGAVPHSVTSESTVGAYVMGSVGGVSFDTGLFTGTRSFTIPASAATGTVIPYFCRNHMALMVNATRVHLTIGTPSTTTPTTPTTPSMPTTPMPSGPGMY